MNVMSIVNESCHILVNELCHILVNELCHILVNESCHMSGGRVMSNFCE